MKKILQIIATNWIHLVGFYLMSYAFGIISKIFGLEGEHETWQSILISNLLLIPVAFLWYGPLIIGGFYAVLTGLDVLCFTVVRQSLWKVLLLEWVLIVPIFIWWAFDNHFWLWLALAFSFLLTQWMRRPEIERILQAKQRG
ncbi:hypothetical protein ACW9KT_21865 [Hymenobacter sp. HD11105]